MTGLGLFLEPLGLYLLVELDGEKIVRVTPSTEPPYMNLEQDLAEVLSCSIYGAREFPLELLDLSSLTAFQRSVLQVVVTIPPGETLTYGDVARTLDRPGAARAVGRALSANPFPLIIPCHRVVAKGGIGGYSFGQDLKRRLLELEKELEEKITQNDASSGDPPSGA